MSEERGQRLAIAISGAVSLGSYEAGVMYETLRAITYHNNKYKDDPKSQIKIDVVTGASAGGMTAAILVQKLLFDADALMSEKKNALAMPWVYEVNIDSLLSSEYEDDFQFSLLSSNFVKSIADKHLLGMFPVVTPKPHPAAADSISLGLAMSNINGINYNVKIQESTYDDIGTESNFTETRFQDRYYSEIDASDKWKVEEPWKAVTECALSSGAFPFAFRPLGIERDETEEAYRTQLNEMERFGKRGFTYVDGGVFNNSPLGMAKKLTDRHDEDKASDKRNRFYLYVSPEAKKSMANTSLSAETAKLIKLPMALFSAIFGQARFQDWMMTHSKNAEIKKFDAQAEKLQELVNNQNKEYFSKTSQVLLGAVFQDDLSEAAVNRKRLKSEFADEYDAMVLKGGGDQGVSLAETWLDALVVFEKLSGVVGQDHMKVYAIFAKTEELAGEELQAFGGFMDEEYRKYDYDLGRKNAYLKVKEWSKEVQEANTGKLFITAPPDAPVFGDYRPNIENEKIKDIDPNLREKMLEHTLHILDSLLKTMFGGGAIAWAKRKLAKMVLKGKLKDFLGL